MIKIYIPTDKSKKTKSRGFWLDSNTNKVYYDYIDIQSRESLTKKQLKKTCKHYKQLALFYTRDETGYIYNNDTGKIDILKNKKTFKHTGNRGLKYRLKKLLLEYEGLTVHINGNNYIIEVYYNE